MSCCPFSNYALTNLNNQSGTVGLSWRVAGLPGTGWDEGELRVSTAFSLPTLMRGRTENIDTLISFSPFPLSFSSNWSIHSECPRPSRGRGWDSSDAHSYTVTQDVGSALLSSVWSFHPWSKAAATGVAISEPEGKDMESKERRFAFWEMAWNLLEMGMMFTLLPLTLHWPEPRHMATLTSKGS